MNCSRDPVLVGSDVMRGLNVVLTCIAWTGVDSALYSPPGAVRPVKLAACLSGAEP